MALPKNYTQAVSRIPELFTKIRDGQAPDHLSQQIMKDWGFTSSNDRAMIPLLKTLGFLSPDGKPTSVYHDYRDHSRSELVMGQALKKEYSDIFLIKEYPSDAEKETIQGKFKSYHNVSDHLAGLMMKTFYALLGLANIKEIPKKEQINDKQKDKPKPKTSPVKDQLERSSVIPVSGLHYNIQIHLPATKDIEVYNAIFKSLKEHIFEQ